MCCVEVDAHNEQSDFYVGWQRMAHHDWKLDGHVKSSESRAGFPPASLLEKSFMFVGEAVFSVSRRSNGRWLIGASRSVGITGWKQCCSGLANHLVRLWSSKLVCPSAPCEWESHLCRSDSQHHWNHWKRDAWRHLFHQWRLGILEVWKSICIFHDFMNHFANLTLNI